MKRRDFIRAGVGGSIAACLASPLPLHAQSGAQMRRLGILLARAESDPEGIKHAAAFERTLGDLGWSRGRNLEIETRWWSSDAAKRLEFVRELVALKPDVMLVNSTSYLATAKQ